MSKSSPIGKTCYSCCFFQNGRCFKHPYKLAWSFQSACDDYKEVVLKWVSETITTAPKSTSVTWRSNVAGS